MTTTSSVDLKALAAPTPPDEIKQRKGPSGRTLDYVDARFVMDRLDAAAGPENWRDVYEDLPNGSLRCGLSIRIGDEWITKWDVGDASDIEPVKGMHSDAFKRAGVKWGIARDLYGDHAASAPAPRQQQQPRQQSAPARPAAPGASTAPQRADTSMGLTPKQFFEAAERAGIDRKVISDTAKDLFGQWQVTALGNDQRAHLLEELTHKPKAPIRDAEGKAMPTSIPEPEWEGLPV